VTDRWNDYKLKGTNTQLTRFGCFSIGYSWNWCI